MKTFFHVFLFVSLFLFLEGLANSAPYNRKPSDSEGYAKVEPGAEKESAILWIEGEPANQLYDLLKIGYLNPPSIPKGEPNPVDVGGLKCFHDEEHKTYKCRMFIDRKGLRK